MLIGENVILRRIEKSDFWQLWKWQEKNELYLFSRIDPYVSFDILNEGFEKFFNLKGDFLIESKNGEPLGVISYSDISWKNRTCEIAFKVCENDADLTIALDSLSTLLTFIFLELNLVRVHAYLPEYSSEEISVLEKKGFVLEGKLREHLYCDGCFNDLTIYALLKRDFPYQVLPQLRGNL